MINLIPPKEKRTVLKEYWARVLSVWSFLLVVVGIVTGLLLIPTYVLIQTQLSAQEGAALEVSDAAENFRAAEKLVQEANMTASQLVVDDIHVPAYEIIMEINKAASAEIDPGTYRIIRSEKRIDSIAVQGVARSREALSAFKTALERSPLFETAVVPISDLARDTNLPFAISIDIAPIRNE